MNNSKRVRKIEKKNFGVFVFLLLGLPFIALCGNTDPAEEKPKPLIESAPDFTLESLEGGKVSMSELKGNPVFLNFWASWCTPCREEMPDIDKIYRTYRKKGLRVYAVNSRESRRVIEKFKENTGVDIPILLDKTGSVSKLYRVFGLPVSYFIHRDGKVAASVIGKMTYEDMESHAKEILLKRTEF